MNVSTKLMSFIFYLCVFVDLTFTEISCNSIGDDINKNVFPWAVGIYKNSALLCGGTIISKNLVISAAFCVTDFSTGRLLDLKDYKVICRINEENNQIRNIEKAILHEEYRGRFRSYIYDISILIVKSFELNLNTQPVYVSWDQELENSLKTIERGVIFTYKSTKENNKIDNKLSEIEVTIQNKTTCKENSPTDFFDTYYATDKMCIGYLGKNTTDCGLGGSGLYVMLNDKYYIRGIVALAPATATGKCDTNLPTLCTKVSSYIDWLQEIFKKYKDVK